MFFGKQLKRAYGVSAHHIKAYVSATVGRYDKSNDKLEGDE